MLYKLDEKQILLDYIELERYEAAKEGETKVAIRMLKDGRLSIEEAAEYFSTLTIKDLKNPGRNTAVIRTGNTDGLNFFFH